MARIVPNWAHVRGTVVEVRDVGDPSGFMEVCIRVLDVTALRGTPNLFRGGPGEEIPVLMAPDAIERLGVRPGVDLEADVRRADQSRSFVHPDRVQVEPAAGADDSDGAAGDGAEPATSEDAASEAAGERHAADTGGEADPPDDDEAGNDDGGAARGAGPERETRS